MKVSVKKCATYDYELVKKTIETCLSELGGLEAFVKPGETVLLKPNLLTKKRPDEAVTTNPVFVKAVADILLHFGAKVVIGDSPGGPFTNTLLGTVYKSTGMTWISNETQAVLNKNFGTFTKENPDGLIMKKPTLTDMLNDVDKVVNLAKLKTHAMMAYTGAVKNMFGLVPGVAKLEYHLNISDYDAFADALIDICIAVKPALSFIDGIFGMEGDGPAGGTPVNSKVVLASACPYHLDVAACKFIGLASNDVPILRRLEARGMVGPIDYTGETPESLRLTPFVPASTKGVMNLASPKIPNLLKKFIARYVQTRPVFVQKKCNGCGMCKNSCPAKIIEISDGLPKLDYKDCIRCYCCHELCPNKAVKIHKPLLSKFMRL